ncbi:MAG: hypothetical protein KGZ83_21885 [Sulfuricella sp.]|nr:hypothetical protein [Sulfuricella sp.]
MKFFRLLAGMILVAAAHLAAADSAVASGAKISAVNGFSDSSAPVSLQVCSRQGQAFSCGPLQVLNGWDSLTQTNADSIMTNGGCSNRGNLIYVCTMDTQYGQTFGGTSLIWAVVYGTGAGSASAATATVSTIYVYVLN